MQWYYINRNPTGQSSLCHTPTTSKLSSFITLTSQVTSVIEVAILGHPAKGNIP